MNSQDLLIVPVSADDFEFYYLMKCEKENIYWSDLKVLLIKKNCIHGLAKVDLV